MPDFAACSSKAAGAPAPAAGPCSSATCSSPVKPAPNPASRSDPPDKAPRVQDSCRVQPRFDLLHQPQLGAEWAPQIEFMGQCWRGVKDNQRAAAGDRFAAQMVRQLPRGAQGEQFPRAEE